MAPPPEPIFKVTSGGMLTTLHSFSGADGLDPAAGLVEGTDGNLYGTTTSGGASNDGTVFKLQVGLPSSSTPTIALVQNAEGGAPTIAPNTWVALFGSGLAPVGDSRTWQTSDFVNNQLPTQLDGVSVTLNSEKAYMYYISPTQLNLLTRPDLATGTVQVQVATNAGTSVPFDAQVQAESPSFFIFGGGPTSSQPMRMEVCSAPLVCIPARARLPSRARSSCSMRTDSGRLRRRWSAGRKRRESESVTSRHDRRNSRSGAIRRIDFTRPVSVQRGGTRVRARGR
jgi:uncharacterized repeat protein (TIGR03803 family)